MLAALADILLQIPANSNFNYVYIILASLLTALISYILLIPRLQEKLENTQKEVTTEKLRVKESEKEFRNDIKAINTDINRLDQVYGTLTNNDKNIHGDIEKIYRLLEKQNDKLGELFEKNTTAITKLEITINNIINKMDNIKKL